MCIVFTGNRPLVLKVKLLKETCEQVDLECRVYKSIQCYCSALTRNMAIKRLCKLKDSVCIYLKPDKGQKKTSFDNITCCTIIHNKDFTATCNIIKTVLFNCDLTNTKVLQQCLDINPFFHYFHPLSLKVKTEHQSE